MIRGGKKTLFLAILTYQGGGKTLFLATLTYRGGGKTLFLAILTYRGGGKTLFVATKIRRIGLLEEINGFLRISKNKILVNIWDFITGNGTIFGIQGF